LTYIELIASERLSLPALVSAFNDARDPRARDVLALELAGRYSSTGDGIHARQMLSVISRARHPASFNNRFELLDRQLSSKVTVKLGVLLPANSPSSSPMTGPADEVFEGINHALEEYNASGRTGVSVSLIVRNTDGDESSLQSVRELAASSDVIGIVGPLFSNLALAYSPIVNAGRIAMISPTANANGIAAGSEYVFQANPDVHTRGTAMARYAVRDLGYTKLAVLTSSDPLAKGLADEFVQEAQRLGAEVATVETYSKDSSDYRDQFMRIRKAGVTAEPCISFGSGLSRAQVRSMIRAGADPEMVSRALRKKETIPVGRIFGDRGIEIADSLRLPVVSSLGRAENIEIPVTGMQAIFVSISGSEEIGIVASQLSYFNIKAQLLGGGDWYDQSQLDANKRYVNGVLFLADSFEDKQDSAYAAFEQSYLRDRKKSPTRNTLYGYDTMRLLLTQIEGGAHTREDIVKALRRVSDYRGLHASITLSDGRANTNVHILEYRNNEIVKVEEVNVR
jgi:ABC-type branched-subunit amino acid transport system substrate-binding protein